MTRKRFVKLMMSNGYSRNEATERAKIVQVDGSYVETYVAICVRKSIPDIQQAVKGVADSIAKIANAIADWRTAFTKRHMLKSRAGRGA